MEQQAPDYRARKRGEPTMPTSQRLIKMALKNEVSGCWEWRGTTSRGYGKTITGSRKNGTRQSIAAHRLAYLVFVGTIPSNMEVCHKCDNRKCINPEHLFLGTRQDNVDDREAKGRNIIKSGEANPLAKLTQKQVMEARHIRHISKTPYSELAKKYGVCKHTIMKAIKGKSWKCVKYMPDGPKEEA